MKQNGGREAAVFHGDGFEADVARPGATRSAAQ